MSITFKQLEAFRAVMLTGTTTEAARMLKVSQPAISRLISDLESDIGYNLFEREGRRVRPTSEADILIEEVRKALIGLDQIRQTAVEIGQTRYSRLRLVSIPSVSSTIVTDMIDCFARQNPETSISLEVMSSDTALEWVISQQCDLGIAAGHLENPALSDRVLTIGKSVCILPAGHALAHEETINAAMLRDQSFISFRPDSTYRQEIDAIFTNADVERILKYDARTTEAICSMVDAGLGVSIVGPFSHLPRPTADGRRGLVVKPFDPAPVVEISLMWPTQRTMNSAAKKFVETVCRQFQG